MKILLKVNFLVDTKKISQRILTMVVRSFVNLQLLWLREKTLLTFCLPPFTLDCPGIIIKTSLPGVLIWSLHQRSNASQPPPNCQSSSRGNQLERTWQQYPHTRGLTLATQGARHGAVKRRGLFWLAVGVLKTARLTRLSLARVSTFQPSHRPPSS